MRGLEVRTAIAALLIVAGTLAAEATPPNVVLVITDDQGYGDLACHGNMQIRTPAIDRLHGESVRLTDFHVDPTCAPTRAALMTGRYSSRTGVWHTVMGRSLLRPDEVTLADLFTRAGYATGIFGKWHLGDNYPLRAQDRGFREVFVHGGGGVGQTPDFWGNDYFDDTYWHNGVPQACTGYCTDVWFDAALDFVAANRERPFFAYVSTNAPHSPYVVDEKYSQPYRDAGVPTPRAEFYGMITNIDENVGRLRAKLADLGLAENTVFLFMTDNGTAAGALGRGGYNAGMRGMKGSAYDGGHRVPCFIRYPAGGIEGGRDVEQLTAHVDLLPTLLELCDIELPANVGLDGKSLVPLLRPSSVRAPGADEASGWPERTLFVHSQRIDQPEKWRASAAMTERWRLINGRELYDMQADAAQKNDVAVDHADVVAELRDGYEAWWTDISSRFGEFVRIELGAPEANPTNLTCHDWHAPLDQIPWDQAAIQRDKAANGFWAVDVARAGQYEFTLRMRPAGVDVPLKTSAARLKIGEVETTQAVDPQLSAATLAVTLPAGPAELQTWLEAPGQLPHGAYYVEVRRVD